MGAYNNAMYSLHLDFDQSLIFPSLNFTVLVWFFSVAEQIFQKKLHFSRSTLNPTFGFKQIWAVEDVHDFIPFFFFPLFRLISALKTGLAVVSPKGAEPLAGSVVPPQKMISNFLRLCNNWEIRLAFGILPRSVGFLG